MRIVATNKFLFLCKRTGSNLCDFCNMEIETQEHIFIECDVTQNFWNQLKNYLIQQNFTVNISKLDMCLGKGGNENELIDFIIICAKYYIYSCKYKLILPHIEHFKSILEQRREIEKIIALNNDKIEIHNKKWEKFLPLDINQP